MNPSTLERCNDCGAVLDKLTPLTIRRDGDDEDIPAFGAKWFVAALVIMLVVSGLFVVALPFALSSYDPQGFPGVAILILSAMIAGFFAGVRATYRVYFECAFAGTVAAGVLIPYIAWISDVRAMDTGRYVISGILCILAAGLGAFLGEQLAARKRTPAR